LVKPKFNPKLVVALLLRINQDLSEFRIIHLVYPLVKPKDRHPVHQLTVTICLAYLSLVNASLLCIFLISVLLLRTRLTCW